MSLVLDSSVALSWLHDDERDAAVEAVFHRIIEHGALVPSLWHLEMGNSLTISVRRNRISASVRGRFLEDLKRLNIVTDGEGLVYAWTRTIELADLHSLTVYDACYLELALRCRLPIATYDKALRRAAQNMELPVLP